MSDINAVLTQRSKKKTKSTKTADMAKQSASGNLTSFSGIFSVNELNEHEKTHIEAILYQYATDFDTIEKDLKSLITISSEVKAINNQAALLHGERIQKAQKILTQYKDGAFTAWMIATYGNRQTPYNFLQYFMFWDSLPKALRTQVETMPRQAIYTLASREGSWDKKRLLIENYQGETKTVLLHKIRESFPLKESDKRQQNFGETLIRSLTRIHDMVVTKRPRINKKHKKYAIELLDEIYESLQ